MLKKKKRKWKRVKKKKIGSTYSLQHNFPPLSLINYFLTHDTLRWIHAGSYTVLLKHSRTQLCNWASVHRYSLHFALFTRLELRWPSLPLDPHREVGRISSSAILYSNFVLSLFPLPRIMSNGRKQKMGLSRWAIFFLFACGWFVVVCGNSAVRLSSLFGLYFWFSVSLHWLFFLLL